MSWQDTPWPLVAAVALACSIGAHILARHLLARASPAWRRNVPPLLLALLITAALILVLRLPWEQFASANKLLVWLLAPATVALALPLMRSRQLAARTGPVLLAVGAGCAVNLLWTLLVCSLLGAEGAMTASLQPKTATAAVAVEIGQRNGGLPALAATFAVLSGLIGSWLYPLLWRRGAPTAAMGLAVGTAAHGIGTSRVASEEDPLSKAPISATAASAYAMAIAAIITALLNLPWMV